MTLESYYFVGGSENMNTDNSGAEVGRCVEEHVDPFGCHA